ncbi:BTAD domain-containing putative transcriptional regulator [Spirillospora sp. NPDC048911]|uniref:AfsR/SARP family transcriptional regulator n=1 Tax=Spirillospora sp. NPDC048911 TaxID=3364527 RepID=UPI003714C9FB
MAAYVTRRFSVLGTLRLEVGGSARAVTAGKERTIAAALLLHANETVPVDRLIDYVWEAPPRAARASLYAMVKRLRLSLGDSDVIRTTSSGYLIEAGPGELDLHEFDALLKEAARARERGEPPAERTSLGRALALWRGPALADVPSPELHHSLVPKLEELRLETIRRQLDLDLDAGRHARVVGQLRDLTRDHPLQEGFWSRLMLALYRDNRQAEALAAFAGVRRLLAEELGIDPGAELRDLHTRILRADPALDSAAAPEAASVAVTAGPWERLCQLPPAAADFVARGLDRKRLVEGLADAGGPRVTVVWGPEGVGKTELAVRVAHDLRSSFPDGQWYVALNGDGASPRPVADVLADLLIAIGVPAAALPRSAEARAAVLRARVSDRRVLLVLDGARDAAQVRALLPGTPSAAVLVTSRSALGELPGARRHSLATLTPDEAVLMLREVLGEARVGTEVSAARDLADACAGLPRTLRAASARLLGAPGLALGDLLRELGGAAGHRRCHGVEGHVSRPACRRWRPGTPR